MEKRVRLLVVDDQSLVRQGLSTLLSIEDDFEVVGEAADGTEACLMVERLAPDLVLMDMRIRCATASLPPNGSRIAGRKFRCWR